MQMQERSKAKIVEQCFQMFGIIWASLFFHTFLKFCQTKSFKCRRLLKYAKPFLPLPKKMPKKITKYTSHPLFLQVFLYFHSLNYFLLIMPPFKHLASNFDFED